MAAHYIPQEVPRELQYTSKALCMFQRVDGADVCLFSMYVQEYGAEAPPCNAGRVYVAYLDSVEYFRPRAARTHVYHEILAGYLDWVRRRGVYQLLSHYHAIKQQLNSVPHALKQRQYQPCYEA